VLGVFCVWFGISTGRLPWYMLGCLHFSVFAAGMWFRIRTAGYVFGVASLFLGLVGVIGLIVVPNSLSLRRCFIIAGNIYAAQISWEWARKLQHQTSSNLADEIE
jgi:hypothetical protein